MALFDASLVYGDDFSLARVLVLAKLRSKDLLCFSKQRGPAPASHQYFEIGLASQRACPRLLSSTSAPGTAHHVAVPLYVFLPERTFPLHKKGMLSWRAYAQDLVAAGLEVYGMEVSYPCPINAWVSRLDAARKEVASSSAAALPTRFKEPEAWDYGAVRKEHPLYTTSNHQIGVIKPSQYDMHDTWAGMKSSVSGLGLTQKSSAGFRTAIRSSKIHGSMDGW